MELNESVFKKASLVAFVLFSLSLIVNIICVVGFLQKDTLSYNLTDSFPFVWALFVGVFLVVPMILAKNVFDTRKKLEKTVAGAAYTKPNLMEGVPTFAKAGFILLQLYGGACFFFMMMNYGATPEIVENGFGLYDHGKLIRSLTEAEYHTHQAVHLASTSAIWMVFYGAGGMLLYPFKK